jgi:magnesium transporter
MSTEERTEQHSEQELQQEQAGETTPGGPAHPLPDQDSRTDASAEDAEITAEDLEHVHPADVADQLEELPLEDQVRLVESLPLEDAAETLEEMEEHVRVPLLKSLDPELAADLLEEMSPDDAADALDELGPEYRERLLRRVERDDARALKRLMRYDPDTAGGVMNTEILVLDQGLSTDQAIGVMRKEIEDKEIPYYAYLIDESERLVGVASLRDILQSRPGTLLKSLVRNQSLISVVFDVDKEEVAHQLGHYNFLALPVVDYDDRLLGVVTHDDIIDIIHDEASEDMQGMFGAGGDETVDTPWLKSVGKRLPWLVINVVNSAIAAYVVHLFEGTIAQMAILAALMHIVSNQAGNTGQQSLAVIIRQLAMERFDRRRSWLAVWRETKIGFANGLLIGALVLGAVFLITQKMPLGLVMAAALGLNMVIGAVAGASIPLLLKEMGRDPAQASSIFLTTLTDSAGFFIFLGLAAVYLLG